MDTSKKEMKGMIFVIIGSLVSSSGMITTTFSENGNLALGLSILGVLIILYGLFRIFKANKLIEKPKSDSQKNNN